MKLWKSVVVCAYSPITIPSSSTWHSCIDVVANSNNDTSQMETSPPSCQLCSLFVVVVL
jgi:hypothetical protein